MADISKLLKQADDAAKRKSYDLAIDLYQQALMLDSDSEKARLALREVELRKEDDFGPPSPVGAFLGALPHSIKAATLSMSGKNDLAAVAYERILAKNPRNAKVSFKLAAALTASDCHRSALAVYKGITLWDPKNFEAHLHGGETARRLNRLDEALELFSQAKELNPKDKRASDAHRDVSAMMSLQPRESAGSFRELVKESPGAGAADGDGSAHTDMDALVTAFNVDPGDADAAIALATAQQEAGKLKDAFETLKQARQAAKGDHRIEMAFREIRTALMDRRLERAETKHEAGGLSDADLEKVRSDRRSARIDFLKYQIEREPTRYDLRFDLGVLLFDAGQVDDAIASFQQARKDPKKSRDAAFWLGRGFLVKEKHSLAVKQFESALDTAGSVLDPKAKETLYFLGQAHLGAGSPAEAKSCFERIYEEDIHYQDVAQRLEDLA